MQIEVFQSNRAVRPQTVWRSMADMYNYLEENKNISALCEKIYQTGDKTPKQQLPAMMPMGNIGDKTRKKENCTPTGLVMIDIDGQELLKKDFLSNYFSTDASIEMLETLQVRLVHITPSGKGLRLLVSCHHDGMEGTIKRCVEELALNEIGSVDPACKDLSRLSYLVPANYIIYAKNLFDDVPSESIECMKKYQYSGTIGKSGNVQKQLGDVAATDEQYKSFEYNGFRVADIVNDYIESTGGAPVEGMRHTVYNDLVALFRNICNNNPAIVHAVLPSWGNPVKETWAQCVSICSSNRTTKIDSKLYFWLRDRNMLAQRNVMPVEEDEKVEPIPPMPKLPPIFRQYVNAAPEDFKVPTVIALLPILGTLTSHVRAKYIDDSEQSTEFISLLFAPPSSGKSFIRRLSSLLQNLRDRDELANAREAVWAELERKKSANDKGQEQPKVSVRIVKPLISIPELLTKMRNNHGHHMYIEAEELDTFAKSNRTSGGDKSDLWRVTWDNGFYGQYYKSVNTFKGEVQMFMNLLFTSTQDQIDRFFKNVEDGLVTRFSVCPIENQTYAKFTPWKPIPKTEKILIDNILHRLECSVYKMPLKFNKEDLIDIKAEDFDKIVPWQYDFQPFVELDMTFLYQPLLDWLEKERVIAAESLNEARDVFRRRVAVKGFRLGMVCMALYKSVGKREKQVITDFVLWFCSVDLRNSLYQFGQKYNELQQQVTKTGVRHEGIFHKMADKFSLTDLRIALQRAYIKTPPRKVIWLWKSNGIIKKEGDVFTKIKKQ